MVFYFKNIPLKRKTYLQRNKKTKMEDDGGKIFFSVGNLLRDVPKDTLVPEEGDSLTFLG